MEIISQYAVAAPSTNVIYTWQGSLLLTLHYKNSKQLTEVDKHLIKDDQQLVFVDQLLRIVWHLEYCFNQLRKLVYMHTNKRQNTGIKRLLSQQI